MISDKHQVFMEITNPVHGGEGWDFSEVLWSPVASSWNVMKTVKKGDIIIHSVSKNKPHELYGASVVKQKAVVVNEEPLKPGDWVGYDQYYRIELQNYCEFKKHLSQKDFFDRYKAKILKLGEQKSFYALSKDRTSISGTAQKYLAIIPIAVQELLSQWFEEEGIELFDESELVDDNDVEELVDGKGKIPGRVVTSQMRIIRDTNMIKKMKKKYDDRCQICGKTIILPNGKKYSEGHHLKKLGGIHKGPDSADNVIILCPFHHTEFDYGSIAIDPKTKIIEHIDQNNEYVGKSLAYDRTDLNEEYLKYHKKVIFRS